MMWSVLRNIRTLSVEILAGAYLVDVEAFDNALNARKPLDC